MPSLFALCSGRVGDFHRVVKELRTRDPVVFTNGVLYNLMRMGVMDWTGENARGNQSTQAMRLATALASRLIQITNADHANMGVLIRRMGWMT